RRCRAPSAASSRARCFGLRRSMHCSETASDCRRKRPTSYGACVAKTSCFTADSTTLLSASIRGQECPRHTVIACSRTDHVEKEKRFHRETGSDKSQSTSPGQEPTVSR